MKLLVVNTAPSRRNGITSVILSQLQAIDKNGMEIGYVSISDILPEYQKIFDSLGIKTYILSRSIKNAIPYIYRLSNIARHYDIIHVHGNSSTMIMEMLAAKFGGVRIRCVHCHNTTCSVMCLDRLLRPLFYRLCNKRFACGDAAGRWLYGEREFEVINNGINTENFVFDTSKRAAVREQYNLTDKIVLANIANFVSQKNHSFLIDVFVKFAYKVPQARLLLLGAGPLMDEIKQKAVNLAVDDKIIFAGSVPNPADFLSAMDIIVMPSLFEGFPVTLMEGQANGLTSLVSDTITKKTNITGLVNYLSLSAGVDVWASKIEELLPVALSRNNDTSCKAILNIKQNGYDIKQTATRLKQLYFE
ncbi:glycosyltransferase family 1 protein [uncultured Muribaculum sp.]|uniref:glycosyltransferase family 1 protein n=1 Tax=uncultured Muribaculum sp. TaxID=1918613 RepID=UPI0026701353|nr:glycosyltransferase family 1 protein [uncultured Muribaculum sp.]